MSAWEDLAQRLAAAPTRYPAIAAADYARFKSAPPKALTLEELVRAMRDVGTRPAREGPYLRPMERKP